MEGVESFIHHLPKVELHVHLVGSASVPTVLELARRHPDSPVPHTEEGLREFYTYRDFPHFIEVYEAISGLIAEPEDVATLVQGAARDLAAQNVQYAEIQVYPNFFVRNGAPAAAITEALDVAARGAEEQYGIRISYIFDFPGQSADKNAVPTLEHALTNPPQALIGFGIGGIEAGRAPHRDVIRDVFDAAAAAGLHCVPHAGETTGPETVWEAIGHLHAERIGHGINSLRDPRLVACLRERQLPLDVAPTSNVCTRQVPDLADHPLPRMLAEGLSVTLNSDDPPMFGTTLSNEYLAAATVLGLSRDQLAGLAANAVRASFLDDRSKKQITAGIAAVAAADRTLSQLPAARLLPAAPAAARRPGCCPPPRLLPAAPRRLPAAPRLLTAAEYLPRHHRPPATMPRRRSQRVWFCAVQAESALEYTAMTARQQLARLLPLALLILLAIAGLRGEVAAPRWDGPLKADGAAIGLALEVVFGVLLVITLRRDSTARRERERAPATEEDRADVPAVLRFALKWVLGAAMTAVAVVLIANLHLHLFSPRSRPLPKLTAPAPRGKLPRTGSSAPSTFHIPLGPILYGLLIAVLLAAVVISIWWSSRLRRPAAHVPIADLAEDSEGLRGAVESGRAALAELDDARAAIIACYLAMERSLADRGTARQAADTPDELLARAAATGIVRGPAARRLTTLFYEARFSTHPLGPGQRDAAKQALDDLAAELAAGAAAAAAAGEPAEAAR